MLKISLKYFFLQILFLTVPGVILSTVLIGSVIKLLNNEFTWKLSLLLGSVLSPTDPISIVNILKNLNMSKKLLILIEGESLFNDGTSYVIFSLLKYSIITNDLSIGYIITNSSVEILLSCGYKENLIPVNEILSYVFCNYSNGEIEKFQSWKL